MTKHRKVYIAPDLESAPYGIKRVIEAMHQWLPSFGWEVVANHEQADVVNLHAMTQLETSKPVVYSSHGMYWGELDWPSDHLFANQVMIGTMKRAQAITVPSHWVRQSIARGLLRNPTVIHHGINHDEFVPQVNQGYVLWNKARADVVSDPSEMNRVAALLPDIGFVSTVGEPTKNVQIVGITTHSAMKDMVAKAAVYLATARETFGIGTLEAMASGVPVAGWAHGGQTEIVKQGVTGYLAPHGDYQALAECIRLCIRDRDQLGENARTDVATNWLWLDKIHQYAQLFDAVYEESVAHRPKVSILVTAHNLAQYLPETLKSVAAQSLGDWECLIIDDASEDDTPAIAQEFVNRDPRFVYLPTPRNLKLSGARNFGFAHATGRYILPLDADDILLPEALKTLSAALDNDPHTHIAYGHLEAFNEENSWRNDWPFDRFDWFGQMAHLNQLPYCAMMRREVLEQSGGYRVRDWRAEDASFWCRVTSFGFNAQKVTNDPVLRYRLRDDSKGSTERKEGHTDGDWTAWFPWRLGATTGQEGAAVMQKGIRPFPDVVPFGAQGQSATYCWPVWSHHDPIVSVVIPCGPKHAHLLVDALDSVMAQTFPFWEAIVVNDTGDDLRLDFAPYARVVTKEGRGIAAARNAGVAAAKGRLVLFLDADDMLTPNAIYDMLKAHVESDGARYIYTDWYAIRHDGTIETKSSPDYNQRTEKGTKHGITAVVPKEWVVAVGGFDEQIPGWEDWDFWLKMAVNGYCGQRLAIPCFVYRMQTGERREQSLSDKDLTMPIIRDRYEDYLIGKKKMAGCCGGRGDAILAIKSALGSERVTPSPKVSNGMVRLEYTGANTGSITVRSIGGKPLSKPYRLANSPTHKYLDATPEDAKLLVESGKCIYVRAAGIDLQQAAVPNEPVTFAPAPPPPKAAVAPPPVETVAPVAQPEPEQEELKDPSEMNIAEFRQYLVGKTVAELEAIKEAEIAGKNRKTAVSSVDLLLAS